MNLQDWFYTTAIIYMIVWILAAIGAVIFGLKILKSLEEMKVKMELRAQEISETAQSIVRPGVIAAFPLIPIAWRLIRKILR